MKFKLKHQNIFGLLIVFCAFLILYFDNFLVEFFWLFCFSIWLLLYMENKKNKFFE